MSNDTRSLKFVYYCSGHGYGHATRVSAFARHVLSLKDHPMVYIVSSAPKHVFADSIALGALYRNADIDPVIVQPLAYRVDRQKSVQVLEDFIAKKDTKVWDESQWLKNIHADCVLSDAAFLGCLAAHQAGIPSVLITNFSFDSVYSYLSTSLIDEPSKPDRPVPDSMLAPSAAQPKVECDPDIPIPLGELAPLVEHIHSGYRCADLLLRLPGAIPLPSFAIDPALPSPDWVDIEARCFKSFVVDHLSRAPSSYELLPQLPFPDHYPRKPLSRQVRQATLLVRSPDPAVYTPEGRSRLLSSIGIPPHLHNPDSTKILIVSFGGQVFHKPQSRVHSRTHSRNSSKSSTPPSFNGGLNGVAHAEALSEALQNASIAGPCPPSPQRPLPPPIPASPALPNGHVDLSNGISYPNETADPAGREDVMRIAVSGPTPQASSIPARRLSLSGGHHSRPRALSQLVLEGAPPAFVPATPQTATLSAFPTIPQFQAVTIPPTPRAEDKFQANGDVFQQEQEEEEPDARILPDDSWIAIVCGVPKDWGKEDGEELPASLFVAPRDVYMPDLTATADVLLGKLGYGTVSECVDACTPFVYVPRPLFIEEHGLRLYLEQEGVGVELSRTQYEVGEWADAVEEAYNRGREAKARKREIGETGKRKEEGREMAQYVVDWVGRWQAGVAAHGCARRGEREVNGVDGLGADGE
ncbi:hypothetical protein K466DRAFT_592274 [Polyporus arcularius HHB13444]|uniref:Uncharacterized protein n=1 Tax=Polyporus arcularius HHB13444 TaxID=1314778 RepID=A0A5C3NUK6_9APHY|nr:hypothetical protein K466DRAFT_592274 [Polyporus arcularius HHB13444]